MLKFSVIELFAGCGGLALGLEKAGFDPKLLVELNKDAAKTLKLNRPDWNVINKSVAEMDYTGLTVDLVTGGFPCQAFSFAGKKLGFEDIRGTLFFEFARAVKEIQPKMFMAENVKGLLSHDGGKTLQTMISIFDDIGYQVSYKVLNAYNYRVPQKRERLIIIGKRKDVLPNDMITFPLENLYAPINLKDALKDVPQSAGAQYSETKKKIMDLIPEGGWWKDLPIELQKSYLGADYFTEGGSTGVARRLAWDKPSLTLLTSPSQKRTERCHPDETRPLTVREYARIQTFPDEWQFVGSLASQYRQIGNAVPVNMAYEIGFNLWLKLNQIHCLNQ
jgi:DNA (cytosine-5)-methyltransferase 1